MKKLIFPCRKSLKSLFHVPVWAGKTFYGENIIFTFLASPLKCLFKTILTDLSPLCFLQLLKFEKAKWVQHVRFVTQTVAWQTFFLQVSARTL